MKVFFATLFVLVLAFASIMAMQSSSSGKVAKQEDMTQFSMDLAAYMTTVAAKELDVSKDVVKISAKCKPNQGADHTRCWVTIGTPFGGHVEKATSENVRRRGNKFVWDHES